MTEFSLMTEENAQELETMMFNEPITYLEYFNAFSAKGELLLQRDKAERDVFVSIFHDQVLVGFYCLRGLDAGYSIPSFGIYISSKFQGQKLGKAALLDALDWCRINEAPRLLLKVSPKNIRAWTLYKNTGFTPKAICDVTGHTIMEIGCN